MRPFVGPESLMAGLNAAARRSARRAWALLAALALAQSAAAATLFVTNTADSGSGSLRNALITANSTPAADTINFNIPGDGPFLIQAQSNLPTITAPLVIDGYSQLGAFANTLEDASNAAIQIQLEGAPGLALGRGLSVCSSDVAIRGLAIAGFSDDNLLFGNDQNNAPCPGVISNDSVTGCFLGLRADGSAPLLPNGVSLRINRAGVKVGGTLVAERNVISTLNLTGISLINAAAGTRIDGNLLGTDPSGLLDRGNASAISLANQVSGVFIGFDRGNLIAFSNDGIRLNPGSGSGNRIANNRFVDNGQAIDLGDDGISFNDPDDADSGRNDLLNHPVITSATRTPAGITIAGTLDRPSGNAFLLYSIEVHASRECSVSGFGGGERRLGSALAALANGNSESFSFNLALDEPLLLGTAITATTTDSNGSTSEFSACTALTEGSGSLVVTSTADSGAGTLRAAITAANANADANVIRFNIPGAGPHLLQVSSLLPTITAPVLIDGYSQPGSQANTLTFASNAVINVQLDATGAAIAGGVGLAVCSPGVIVRGLSITNFASRSVTVGRTSSQVGCAGVTNSRISGNFLGLNPDGSLPNFLGASSVNINDASASIGSSNDADRNVISSGNNEGILLEGAVAGTRVDGNLIGTDPSGLQDRGNGAGLHLRIGAGSLAVGRVRDNLIAFNSLGSRVDANAGSGNDLAGNASFANLASIDLGADGPTANDVDDADAGPNGLQNYPELSLAQQRNGGGMRLVGHLDVPQSAAIGRYTITAYASGTCLANGFGQGTVILGSRDVALIDPNSGISLEHFAIELSGNPAIGEFVTATATAPDGSTSEYSRCIAVVGSDQLLRSGFE